MKKFLSVVCLLAVVLTAMLFVGCSCNGCNKDGTPPDHMLASVPEEDGFTLYIPDAWKYTRADGVISAYMSSLNTAALTVARVETTHTEMAAYWQESEAELREIVQGYTLVQNGATSKVDGHDAYIYEYVGVFPSKVVNYRVLQYFVMVGTNPSEGMICLTLSASDVLKESTGVKDFNETLLETFKRVLDVFKVGAVTVPPATPNLSVEDKKAPAGMKNATLNEHIGMTVYVPETWQVEVSDGFIGAKVPNDGGTVGITSVNFSDSAGGSQSTLTERLAYYNITLYDANRGITLMDYWNLLKAEYADYFADGTFSVIFEPVFEEKTDEAGNKTLVCTPEPTVAGETTYYSFRISGTHNGQAYEVSLYMFRQTNDWKNQFRTLTYTTKAGAHETYLPDVANILQEVTY